MVALSDPADVPASTDELLQIAVRLARTAGQMIVSGRASAVGDVATKSSITDVVTAMDRQCEAWLREQIRTLRPHDAIVGEEAADAAGSSGVRWIIDPIDGTVNYLYGLSDYAVSVAVESDGEVIAGAVDKPVTRETFYAERGSGAWCNGTRLRGSAPESLAVTLVATGFSYDRGVRRQQGALLGSIIDQVRDVRRAGAAALDLCYAAAGRVDAYFERDIEIWDIAAGGLIATEAGLDVLMPGDNDGMIIASAPSITDALRDLLAQAGP